MKRRGLLVRGATLVGLVMLQGCAIPSLRGNSARAKRIGYLGPGSSGPYPRFLEVFREEMRALRYVEGQNLDIEYRFTDGGLERAPGFAAELVRQGVDVIVTTGVEASLAAMQATETIPIVGAVLGPDPVSAGLAASLAQPGGNVTGLAAGAGRGQSAKRLQILSEVVPSMKHLAVLLNPSNPEKLLELQEIESAARQTQLQVRAIAINGSDVDGALQELAGSPSDGLMVLQDPVTAGASARIVSIVEEQRLPAAFTVRLWADAGGLMTYGIDTTVLFRRAPSYVDRILKGARPGDLPIEQPNVYELVINLQAARTIGLTIPPAVLAQATEIIQ